MTAPSSVSTHRWPAHLQSLVSRLETLPAQGRDELRGQIWLVLRSALASYARFHTARMGRVPASDLADLVSQKSLDLLSKIDLHEWKPAAESEGQIRAFLSTVARNGVVDVVRSASRISSHAEVEDTVEMHSSEHNQQRQTPATGAHRLEAEEFVTNLRQCVEELSPRARKLWFFRVLYEMPSKWIARHPDIQMTVGNVDVTLQRCRQTVGTCMEQKGLKLGSLPPGTFAALWESCTRERSSFAEEEGHA